MFHQTFQPRDLLVVLLLVVLEGLLSLDNALVLGVLAGRLPAALQRKALTYGLLGALVLRFFAVAVAATLLRWRFLRLLGGAYLIFVAAKHFISDRSKKSSTAPGAAATDERAFWLSVATIELTDLAFAIDSILAAVALVGPAPAGWTGLHPKFWVILLGGFLGLLLMRFAAILFIRLLARFPRFEISAYLLVLVIGIKLVADYAGNFDFQNPTSAAFWVFWSIMVLCIAVGFLPRATSRKGLIDAIEG